MWITLLEKQETAERFNELQILTTAHGTFFKSVSTYTDPAGNYSKAVESSLDLLPLGLSAPNDWIWVENSVTTSVKLSDKRVNILYTILLSDGNFLYRTVTEYRDLATGSIKYSDENMQYSGSAASSGSAFNVQYFVLTGTDITNKYLVLPNTPSDSSKVLIAVADLIGDPENGLDYTVTGQVISWNGLGLQPYLTAGMKLTVTYAA
jgi:hypothetical protein